MPRSLSCCTTRVIPVSEFFLAVYLLFSQAVAA